MCDPCRVTHDGIGSTCTLPGAVGRHLLQHCFCRSLEDRFTSGTYVRSDGDDGPAGRLGSRHHRYCTLV